ncbi:hypothetical protein ACFQV8_01295 [Pseudonocardia benzenivorans]
MLADAERPAIIVGGGAHDPEAVLRLAEAIGAPVVTTWLRKGAIPHSDPAFLGALGYGAHEVSDRLVREADVLVALGCRFSEFTTKRWTLIPESAALVHVDIDRRSSVGCTRRRWGSCPTPPTPPRPWPPPWTASTRTGTDAAGRGGPRCARSSTRCACRSRAPRRPAWSLRER